MTLPADDLAVAQAVVEEAWRVRGDRRPRVRTEGVTCGD